jgi:hypothetical protein
MFTHECDLLMLSKAGYATEVEIKVSKSDLIADKKKRHGHRDYKNRIKYLYFAIPEKLKDDIDHIPERAGIIVVREGTALRYNSEAGKRIPTDYVTCDIIRKPETMSTYKFTDSERYQLARLGALRIWGLKKKIAALSK